MSRRSPTFVEAPSVAGPRQGPPRETYTGEDLLRTPVRPGAQDAFRIPSLVAGKPVTPAQLHADLRAPVSTAPAVPHSRGTARLADFDRPAVELPAAPQAAEPTPTPSPEPPPSAVYRPRTGSAPSLVIEHLQTHGGHLLYSEISAKFGVDRHSMTPIFARALAQGVLIKLKARTSRGIAEMALALPGYRYIPRAAAASPAPDDSAPAAASPATHAGEAFALTLVNLARTLENTAQLLHQHARALIANPQALGGQ